MYVVLDGHLSSYRRRGIHRLAHCERAGRRAAIGFACSIICARATDSNLAALEGRVEFIEGDLVNPRDVERALEGVEVVFHEAALASVPRSVDAPLDTNAACVTGTVTLLDVARRSGVRRVVFGGSSSAYGDQPTPAKHERLAADAAVAVRGGEAGRRILLPGVHRRPTAWKR